MVKRIIKTTLQHGLRSRYNPIVVASMGRVGSTLVFDALCDSLATVRFGRLHELGRRIIADTAWTLSDCHFLPGVVYKSHALAHELPLGSNVRVVFLFGVATDAALSVYSCRKKYGAEWIAEHFCHMRANGGFNELSERDVLRFEEQIDGWLTVGDGRVLALRYERLWDNVDVLSNFVGFRVRLPKRRARASRAMIDSNTIDRFSGTYRRLDEKIARLPDRILRINGHTRCL